MLIFLSSSHHIFFIYIFNSPPRVPNFILNTIVSNNCSVCSLRLFFQFDCEKKCTNHLALDCITSIGSNTNRLMGFYVSSFEGQKNQSVLASKRFQCLIFTFIHSIHTHTQIHIKCSIL